MKLRRSLATALTATFAISALSGCGSESAETTTDAGTEEVATEGSTDDYGLDENRRFTETRKITVEVYDRGNDGGSDPTNNVFTDYIKAGMLERHNVEVEFVAVPRWTEVDEINNLLAAGTAPDICVTYSAPTIQTYAEMGGVLDLAPYVGDQELFPNLWDLLGETNIYWDQSPTDGTLYNIEAYLRHNLRVNTFIREDWLKKLNLPEPTTLEEFENTLIAFRDNADTLLGADADKMIPFTTSYDVAYRTSDIQDAFVPDGYSDKEKFINGFDDRRFTWEGNKEAVRLVNKWYNEDLVWKDFPLYGSGDPTEDNYIKSGYVGAFISNWDYPYRDSENGIAVNLQRLVGDDAAYIAINTTKNEAGKDVKYLSPAIDRKVFFPATNDEPVASLLYLDFMSDLETRMHLQVGEEGTNHQILEDGSYQILPVTGDYVQNSPLNLDYTITINGLDLGDEELTIKSLATSYANVDPSYIERAYEAGSKGGIPGKNANVGIIAAENGLGTALAEKRDVILNKAIVASTADFDAVYDQGVSEYMGAGGQAIKDEREAKWTEFFGDTDTLPSN